MERNMTCKMDACFIDIIKIIHSGLRPEMGGADPPMEAIHNGHCLRSKIHTMTWLT